MAIFSGRTTIKGLDKVMRNLNKEIMKIKGATLKGMLRGAAIIRKSMDNTPPLIPVDTGAMRSSWFIVTSNAAQVAGKQTKFHNRPSLEARMTDEHALAVSSAIESVRGKEPAIAFGFSAFYVDYVHENIDASFKRPGAGAKFFEAAIKNTLGQVKTVIRTEARIRK
jgi:hypothetical protein